MFRVLVICILIINSIFWGFYPENIGSPHEKILNKFGIKKYSVYLHILLGLIFYLFALLIAHNFIN